MTSEDRREARYQRRRAKREEKRKRVLEIYGDFNNIASRNALSKSAIEAAKGVRYKASVKRYMLRRITNVAKTSDDLMHGRDVRKGFVCFGLCERGKHRDIMSVHFSERVPQKSLNHNALVPVMTRSLIYDNGASQKNKGTSFTMKRVVKHLRWHYRHYGNEGYVLLIDFKNYFGNIDHEIAKQQARASFDDERIIKLTCDFIDSYYDFFRKKAIKCGENPDNVQRKGLGLGSETNQTIAVRYRSPLDHFIKEVLRIKCYDVYMDDSLLVHISKDYLSYCLEEIRKICSVLKIEINEKKTMIVKLSHGFTFLKTQIFVTDTGKIIRKPCRSSTVRHTRRMKKQKKLLDAGVVSFIDVSASYASVRSYLKNKTARKTLYRLDKLYNQLFINDFAKRMECQQYS